MSSSDNTKGRDPKKGEKITDLAHVVLTDEEDELFDDEFVEGVVEEATAQIEAGSE